MSSDSTDELTHDLELERNEQLRNGAALDPLYRRPLWNEHQRMERGVRRERRTYAVRTPYETRSVAVRTPYETRTNGVLYETLSRPVRNALPTRPVP